MAADDTKLNYLSTWDIDQLLTTGVIPVSLGNTAIYMITGNISIPEYEIQFQPTGSTFWYQVGQSSSNSTLAGTFTFYSYVSGSSIFINAPSTGMARYFVWADKVDY